MKRESMEEHLYECDHCLALYMESIDEQQENLPMINDDSFTNEVMTQINFKTLQPNENIKNKLIKANDYSLHNCNRSYNYFYGKWFIPIYFHSDIKISRNLQNITSLLSHNKL